MYVILEIEKTCGSYNNSLGLAVLTRHREKAKSDTAGYENRQDRGLYVRNILYKMSAVCFCKFFEYLESVIWTLIVNLKSSILFCDNER
jgi:hypothetical protein